MVAVGSRTTGCQCVCVFLQDIELSVWPGLHSGLLDWTTDMALDMVWVHSCVFMKVSPLLAIVAPSLLYTSTGPMGIHFRPFPEGVMAGMFMSDGW